MTAVVNRTWPSYSAARKMMKFDESEKVLPRSVSVTIAGNANVDFLVPGFSCALRDAGIASNFTTLPMNSWLPDALGSGATDDFWVLWLSSFGESRGQTERPDSDVAAVENAVDRLQARGANVIVVLPEALDAEDDPFSDFSYWRRQLSADLRRALEGKAVLVDVEHLQRRIGMDAWSAKRYWSVAKVPCHPDAATAIGGCVGDIVARILYPVIRAVIVDLDDTLWGGVVGDDGVDALELDRDGNGRAFLEMQRFLKDLGNSGIPLSVVSKNEPHLARSVFDQRSEMLLSLSDFVYFEASWNDKVNAISEIVKALNLLPEQVCFLDDSSFERSQARERLPGLCVPELDQDPEQRVSQLIRTGLFQVPQKRQEDIERIEMYKLERERRSSSVGLSPEAYLMGLDMKMVVEPVGIKNLPRVANLVMKTNQFNVTGVRPGPSEINIFAEGTENFAFAFRLLDKFGDYGIIAVLLAEPVSEQVVIRNWVMSCRVFSRGVERACLSYLLEWAKRRGFETVELDYLPTSKNQLLRGILTDLSFMPYVKGGECSLSCVNEHQAVRYIRASDAVEPVHFIEIKEIEP